MSPDRGPAPIRASLEKLLAGLGSPEIDSMTMLVERWPEVVGERLAERIQAVAVRRRELLVTVDDPAWASQIAWLEAQLLERVEGIVVPGGIVAVRVGVEAVGRGKRGPWGAVPYKNLRAHETGKTPVGGLRLEKKTERKR